MLRDIRIPRCQKASQQGSAWRILRNRQMSTSVVSNAGCGPGLRVSAPSACARHCSVSVTTWLHISMTESTNKDFAVFSFGLHISIRTFCRTAEEHTGERSYSGVPGTLRICVSPCIAAVNRPDSRCFHAWWILLRPPHLLSISFPLERLIGVNTNRQQSNVPRSTQMSSTTSTTYLLKYFLSPDGAAVVSGGGDAKVISRMLGQE